MKEERHFTYYIFRLEKYLRSKAHERLSKVNIHPGQGRILMLLFKRGQMTQNEISNIIRTKPSTVTDVIKKLEKSNSVIRAIDKNDKRIINVSLTPKGKKDAKITLKIFQEIEKLLTEKLPKDHLDTFYSSLQTLHSAFDLEE